MAGKQTTLTYGQPQKYAFGGQLFTATSIEFTTALGEYPKGGVELKPKELGMTVGLVSAAWATPLSEKKALTKKEGGYKAYPTEIRLFGKTKESPENIVLYSEPVFVVFGAGAEKKFELELEEAEGKSLGEFTSIVFAFGK